MTRVVETSRTAGGHKEESMRYEERNGRADTGCARQAFREDAVGLGDRCVRHEERVLGCRRTLEERVWWMAAVQS